MSIYYEVSKCKYIAFIKNLKYLPEKYKNQKNIYKLGFNNSDKLDQINDIQDEHFTLIINSESNLFSDIIFEINEEKIGESSKKGNKTQDVCRDVLLGGGQQLEAFSNNRFTIIPGKRHAGIQSLHPKQNHDIIDSLARNGLMVTPITSTQFSVGQLFNILMTKKNFDIIIVHSALEVSIRESNCPGDYVEPAYIIGKGEIVTVFYRYICLYFFGYLSVNSDEDRDRIYDI